jgi:hypothetical protein
MHAVMATLAGRLPAPQLHMLQYSPHLLNGNTAANSPDDAL